MTEEINKASAIILATITLALIAMVIASLACIIFSYHKRLSKVAFGFAVVTTSSTIILEIVNILYKIVLYKLFEMLLGSIFIIILFSVLLTHRIKAYRSDIELEKCKNIYSQNIIDLDDEEFRVIESDKLDG